MVNSLSRGSRVPRVAVFPLVPVASLWIPPILPLVVKSELHDSLPFLLEYGTLASTTRLKAIISISSFAVIPFQVQYSTAQAHSCTSSLCDCPSFNVS